MRFFAFLFNLAGCVEPDRTLSPLLRMATKYSKEWEQEFEFLRAMQDDSLAMSGASVCMDKCVSLFYTHSLLPHENKCVENCLEKYNQSGLLVDFNFSRFQNIDGKKA